MTGWVAAAALALAATPASSLPGEVQAFAQEVSQAQQLELKQSWKVPGESGEAWLLRFENPRDPSSHQVPLILWGSPDQIFTRRAFNVGSSVEVSADEAHRRFSLRLTDALRTYGIRDGRPVNVVVTRAGALDGLGQGEEVEDWDALTFRRTLEAGEGKERKVVETDEGAILLVTSDDPSTLPKTWTQLTDGKPRWAGRGDASFEVRAEPAEAGVALRLKAKDDVKVPVPEHGSDRAFLAADHFELWWRSPKGLRQVGAGLTAKGEVAVRALFLEDPSLPLPRASVEDGEIVLQFDAASLGGDAAIARGVPFTVAYSDADGKRGRSVISTSAFHFRLSTLGELIALPGFSRWPVPQDEAPWCPYRPGSPLSSWSDC